MSNTKANKKIAEENAVKFSLEANNIYNATKYAEEAYNLKPQNEKYLTYGDIVRQTGFAERFPDFVDKSTFNDVITTRSEVDNMYKWYTVGLPEVLGDEYEVKPSFSKRHPTLSSILTVLTAFGLPFAAGYAGYQVADKVIFDDKGPSYNGEVSVDSKPLAENLTKATKTLFEKGTFEAGSHSATGIANFDLNTNQTLNPVWNNESQSLSYDLKDVKMSGSMTNGYVNITGATLKQLIDKKMIIEGKVGPDLVNMPDNYLQLTANGTFNLSAIDDNASYSLKMSDLVFGSDASVSGKIVLDKNTMPTFYLQSVQTANGTITLNENAFTISYRLSPEVNQTLEKIVQDSVSLLGTFSLNKTDAQREAEVRKVTYESFLAGLILDGVLFSYLKSDSNSEKIKIVNRRLKAGSYKSKPSKNDDSNNKKVSKKDVKETEVYSHKPVQIDVSDEEHESIYAQTAVESPSVEESTETLAKLLDNDGAKKTEESQKVTSAPAEHEKHAKTGEATKIPKPDTTKVTVKKVVANKEETFLNGVQSYCKTHNLVYDKKMAKDAFTCMSDEEKNSFFADNRIKAFEIKSFAEKKFKEVKEEKIEI